MLIYYYVLHSSICLPYLCFTKHKVLPRTINIKITPTMKTTALVTGLFLMITSVVKSNASVTTSQDRMTGNFYGLIVNGSANVILTHGENSSVRVEGDQRSVQNV